MNVGRAVDCGIAALAEAGEASRLGLELIITDHHELKDCLPSAAAVVHPRLPGTSYRIEYATSLTATTWTKLVDLSLPSSPFTFIDSGALNANARFYRVLVP